MIYNMEEQYDEEDEQVNTCYCGEEIETGDFCSRECAKLFFDEIT